MFDIKVINSKIIQMTQNLEFLAKDEAPNTFEALKQATSLVVWDGASESTIYQDARINHMFRAWHDSLHLKLNAPFTLQGELLVAKFQANQVNSDLIAKLIMAEVAGQAEYFAKFGEFPVDQKQFIENELRKAA